MSAKTASTLWRLIVPVALLITAGAALLVMYETALQIGEVENAARQQAGALTRLLSATEGVIDGQVWTAMRMLQKRGLGIGPPAIHGSVTIQGQTLPNLTLGEQPQALRHALVDGLSADLGGTATLFVKSGEDFVRISTNVTDRDGRRAVLTRLDPQGKAIAALRRGQPFYGVVDILGTPYFTGYEPMFDGNGALIGAWYVGYPVDMQALRHAVEDIRFLDSGFCAVVDSGGTPRFHSTHLSRPVIETLIHNRPTGWSFIEETLPQWGFKVIMAYPLDEARAVGYRRALALSVFGAFITLLLLLLLANQLKKLVYKPLGGDPVQAYDLVQRMAAGDLREDDTRAEQGTLIAHLLTMRSNLRHMLETLRQNADRLRLSSSVFEHANDAIFIAEPDARIIEINPAFTAVTHYRREEALGKTPRELLAPLDDPGLFDKGWEMLKESGSWRGETWLSGKDGMTFAAWVDIFAILDPGDRVTHYVGVFSDITHAKEQQQKLERMAYHDPLTQLPNRTLLADRLQQALARAQRSGEVVAVCYFDLDGFKPINDTLGHEAGDMLLVELASRIRACLRADDTVARLGGDEFALLLCNLQGQEECERTLDRVLAAIHKPFQIADKAVGVSASIGYTLYPLDQSEPDTLLRHADQAMYQAKINGGRQYHLFDAEHDRQTRTQRQQRERIEAALPREEFCLHYQPKVDMLRGTVVGMEALIRWRHPELGLRPPSEFLPLVENTPFCIPLGEWVIEEALRQITRWQAQGLEMAVAVNIAARHMMQPDFAIRLAALLALHPEVSPELLQLEITETAAIEDVTGVATIIHDCKQLGVSFALDDFGVGYSSLTYLRRLPVEVVKIDQSFVRDMLQDVDDMAVVAGIISLSRDFQRKVIAEGVETAEHGVQLLRMGCELAQGYGIARPMPPEAVPDWVKGYVPDPAWSGDIAL